MTFDPETDPHIQALRKALVDEHEATIAGVERWAADAAAIGDSVRQRRHLDLAAKLRAMPYPWENHTQAA